MNQYHGRSYSRLKKYYLVIIIRIKEIEHQGNICIMESERIHKKRILSQKDQTKCENRPTIKETKEINQASKTIIKEKLKIIYTNTDQFTSSKKCALVQLILPKNRIS